MKKYLVRLFVNIARAYSHMPIAFHYAVADVIYFFLFYVVRYRRQMVSDNLRQSFPEKSEREINDIERKFYHHLADYFAESAKGLTISDQDVKKRFVCKNIELPLSYLKAGMSVFMYGAHIGNWEWFIALPDHFDKYATMIAFYQKQQNDLFDQVMYNLRARLTIMPVESKKAFLVTAHKKAHNETTISLVLGDQRPRKYGQKIWVDFLGRQTPFLAGPEFMASKLNMVLLYPHFRKVSRGHYVMEFKPICERPKDLTFGEATRRYATLLEDNIREQPEIWLWSHNKWKWKKEDLEENDGLEVKC